MTKKHKRIPIAAAKRICQEYGYDQVVIYARKEGEDGKTWVTTYGRNAEHCKKAARSGGAIMGVVNGKYAIVHKNPDTPNPTKT